MNLILTMAGKYSRFVNEGFKIPKYLLPWGNRSILSEILNELLKSKDFDNIFLVANKADDIYLNHVRKIMQFYNINLNNLICLSDTKGQAETAFLGLSEIKSNLDKPVLFHNIDTILYNRKISDIKKHLKENSGYIDVFKSNNHMYSYVMTKDNLVHTISEKILISDMATSGLYGFSSSNLFLENYDNENYISEIYEKLIKNNYKIYVGEVFSEKDTVVLGTPANYLSQSKLI